jgi:glyoxylase-like metal-dependent hydrolase (beta-lactamase superfamily II)
MSKSILLVDDAAFMRMMLKDILTKNGYNVVGEAVNSYIICSKDRNLIIDTGFNSEESKTSLIQAVKGIGIDLKQTSLLVTHLHSDHSGLATDLSKKGIKVYAGEIDGRIINEMTTRRYWEQFEERKKMYGLAMEDISIDDHPGYKYCPR